MNELLLLLLALPLVADPPVVLSLTEASPELACWEFSLDTHMLLSLSTLTLLVLVVVMVFDEPGPVSFMLPEVTLGSPAIDAAVVAAPLLLTVAEASSELLFIAAPDVALPPVVL